jgi:hypothetical protein
MQIVSEKVIEMVIVVEVVGCWMLDVERKMWVRRRRGSGRRRG